VDGTGTAWAQGEEAAASVAPESGLFARLDPVSFASAMLSVAARAWRNPTQTSAACQRFGLALAGIVPEAAARWSGRDGSEDGKAGAPAPAAGQARPGGRPSPAGGPGGPASPRGTAPPRDKRFADPAWEANPWFFALRQAYLAAVGLAEDLLAAGRGDPMTDAKARLASEFVLAGLAPTNFLPANPTALKRAFDTGGASLLAGIGNFLDDLRNNHGLPRQVDTSAFEVGRNLAATPGKIVFSNDLMELIQYSPQTPRVHAVPLLASPPWINKYYIMDLAPGRSFLEWAVTHERTVFAISYRNPDASMRAVTLDDYLIRGPQAALDIVADITGAPKIDIVGLCLGGALTGMLAAYLAATGEDRIGSVSLLNTLLDYSQPGVLGAFTDEQTVARLERQMERLGVLEGRQMATTFDLLRPNDLIFNYVVSNWLLGQAPPAFDILAWNADNTRMPAAMHTFYLRSLYLRNELARGVMELAGQKLSLSDVKNDVYVVGAVNDHIVPWQASYKATSLFGGQVRYVLSSGGHIAGIVNPPGPKAWYEAASGANPAAPARWREAATRRSGSWWEDWVKWAGKRAGARTAPPPMGSERYPATADAPGKYVHG
jgi:polyhydroxyalkanoate synthase subunit PhaC